MEISPCKSFYTPLEKKSRLHFGKWYFCFSGTNEMLCKKRHSFMTQRARVKISLLSRQRTNTYCICMSGYCVRCLLITQTLNINFPFYVFWLCRKRINYDVACGSILESLVPRLSDVILSRRLVPYGYGQPGEKGGTE